MHDLVHDLARSVLVDEILDARKRGNIGESRIHLELLDDCTDSLQAFTQYPSSIRGLRFLESDKTVSHGDASSSSAKFKSVQVCGKIGIYDDDVFSSAKDLHVLDLSACSIRKLPNSIGNLRQLRYLNAPRVQHWVFPYRVMKLSKLTYLSFRGSSAILALPDSIGEMESLMYLDLSGCAGIKKLSVSFGNLTKLVHLDFSNCYQVTYVSESLKNLTNLQYLDLTYCINIGELSENLGRLLKLRNLNISHSSYVYSDKVCWLNADVLSTLTKLECLSLSSGCSSSMTIKNLPETLNRFANLKCLNLSGLKRQDWQEGPISFGLKRQHRKEGPIAFGNLKNRVYLDLSDFTGGVHGFLETLGSLTKLQHLNLSGGSCFAECTELHCSSMSEAIRNLTELHYLNLSDCSGSEKRTEQAFLVFLESIGNLLNLEHLDLSGNHSITSLPDCFRKLRKLHTLDLSSCFNLRVLPSVLHEMDRLKFLYLKGCPRLNMPEQGQLKKNLLVLPYFEVQSDGQDSRSNLFLLEDVNRPNLVISRLENVKSVQEARSIKLAGKERITILELKWTKDVERSMEDIEVLAELVPPSTLEVLRIHGYNSVRYPKWFVGSGIASHLPKLSTIYMYSFPKCNSLPPLGQLPNLRFLGFERMNGISEINWELCGGRQAFPRLTKITLHGMESLKVWYTTTTYPGRGDHGVREFMFPKISRLEISDCPNLRLEPCPQVFTEWKIVGSCDGVISSWTSVSLGFSATVTGLHIVSSKIPMHQWRLLHHFSGLTRLTIKYCIDVSSSSPEIIRALSSLRWMELENVGDELELPNWLGQLASLEDLTVHCHQVKAPHDGLPHLTQLRSLRLSKFRSMTTLQPWVGTLSSLQRLEVWMCDILNELPESIGHLSYLKDLRINSCLIITSLPESMPTSLERLHIFCCGGITCLPESIQQLTNLKSLDILGCQELAKWCETKENKAKLAHIKEKKIIV